MAHNLMTRNGSTAMFCTGDRDAAWHKLGQRTPNAVTWQEAMRLADLSWPVSKQVLFDSNGKPVSAWGIFREDDSAFLGAVGERYTPIQNKDAFEFVDVLMEATNGAHYDSAGALGNGERIWCSLQSELETMAKRVLENDPLDAYFPACECQDCEQRFPENKLNPIQDLYARVDPEEPMPAGECPECGALCHRVEVRA